VFQLRRRPTSPVTVPGAVRPRARPSSSDVRALPQAAAGDLISSGVVTRAQHPYPARRARRPPHVVSPPCALASREDSAAPRTLRVHVAAAGTRRTGASPPAPTDHPTRKKKGKKSWRGAGRVGRVSQNSNRLGVPRETSEPLAGGGYRPRAPTRRPTSRGLSSRGASPGRFGVV